MSLVCDVVSLDELFSIFSRIVVLSSSGSSSPKILVLGQLVAEGEGTSGP
jgi:hypothetical protein